MDLKDAARLRAYGYHFNVERENLDKCAVEVFGSGRWSHPKQCSRPRGHGDGGVFCAQHAKKDSNKVPPVAGYGVHLLEKYGKDRKPLAEAAAKLIELDQRIAVVKAVLAETPKEAA